jgi:hypothetical protein
MHRQHMRRQLGRDGAAHQPRRGFDNADRLAHRLGSGRHFESDEAAAEHDDVLRRRELRAQAMRLVGRPQRRDIGKAIGQAGKTTRTRARREHQSFPRQYGA